MRHFKQIGCFLAFSFMLHGPLYAAQQHNTAVLRGVVEDPAGQLVPGAEVEAVNEVTQEKFKSLSDEVGKFEFKNLPSGNYIVTVEAEGFEDARKPATVGDADAPPIRIRLELEEEEDEITVTAISLDTPAADANLNFAEFDRDWIRGIPLKDGDPATLASLFLNPVVSGASGAKIIVDGVEDSGVEVPTSGIKGILVNKNPYSAEFGQPGQGRIEAITRDGSRHIFRGDFSFLFRNSALDARNAFAATRPLLQLAIPDFQFNGPVIPNKAAFFLGVRRYIENQSQVINAATPGGPLVQNFMLPDRKTYILGRLDFKFSPARRLSIAYNFKDKSRLRGVGDFNLPERATDDSERYDKLQVSQRSIFSATLLNDVRFALKGETESTSGLHDRPALIVLDAFNAGGAQISEQLREKTFDFQDVASLVKGKHSFRFGLEARPRFFHGRDASNFAGVFKFSSLPAFTDGRPFLFTINQGDPEVHFQQNEFSGFFQDQIQLRRNLSLSAGLRYERQSNLKDFNNLAPRLAFAYSPGGGRTVLRAGAGIFYDRQPEIMRLQSLLYDGFRIRQVVVSNPGFPDPFESQPNARLTTPSLVRIAPDIRNPYVLQESVAVERQLGKRQNYLTVEYTAIRGLKLHRMRNINAPLPETGLRPDANFVNRNQFESSAASRGHSMSVMLRGQLVKNFDYISHYTFSRATDDTGGLFSLPADNYDLRGERGLADFDRRHRFDFAGIYQFPRDFKLSAIVNAWSGSPYTITTGSDDNHDTVANDRPVGIGRNTGRGPEYFNLDLSIKKRFVPLKDNDNTRVEVGLEVFNVFNNVNFKKIIGTLQSPFFGRANSALPARQMQVFLRFRLK